MNNFKKLKNNNRGNIINYQFKTKTYNNGKYEGNWKNYKKEGKEIIHFNNGNRYEGDWKNYKMEGKGICYI